MNTSAEDALSLLGVGRADHQSIWQVLYGPVSFWLVGARGLLTLTYFKYHPRVSTETFLQGPRGDDDMASHLRACLAPPWNRHGQADGFPNPEDSLWAGTL